MFLYVYDYMFMIFDEALYPCFNDQVMKWC